jgi:predicted ribosome quality control (RQC) complex YloA/Tae2 family protein
MNSENENDLKNFRIYKLSDDFEVWVGKNSVANDLLTFKYTKQNDLWFHVSGYSGSHTILKFLNDNTEPDKNTIKIAASIAAYYSKAKNAKSVKVSYTSGKNVQKFKGAKSGTVTIKNEKTVTVKPMIEVI